MSINFREKLEKLMRREFICRLFPHCAYCNMLVTKPYNYGHFIYVFVTLARFPYISFALSVETDRLKLHFLQCSFCTLCAQGSKNSFSFLFCVSEHVHKHIE